MRTGYSQKGWRGSGSKDYDREESIVQCQQNTEIYRKNSRVIQKKWFNIEKKDCRRTRE